jgi:hypothetical protein
MSFFFHHSSIRFCNGPKFKPGAKASYSDSNYQLLGKIIEEVDKFIIIIHYFYSDGTWEAVLIAFSKIKKNGDEKIHKVGH